MREKMQTNKEGKNVEKEIQDSLNSESREGIAPITGIIMWLAFFFALSHAILLPATAKIPMVTLALCTAITLALLRRRWQRNPVTLHGAHAVLTLLVAIVATNILVHLYLAADTSQSYSVALLIVGMGYFYLSRAWFVSVLLTLLVVWAVVLSKAVETPDWLNYIYVYFFAISIGGLVGWMRVRTLVRLFEQNAREKLSTALLRESETRLRSAYADVEKQIQVRTEQLTQSKRRYQELCELLPQPVFETDLEGRLTFSNECALSLFGYSRAEMEDDLNNMELIAPIDRDRAKRNLQRRMNGEEVGGVQYSMLTKDGRTFPALVYSDLIMEQGSARGFRGLVIDISEQLETEAKLREAHDDLQRLITTVNIPIVGTDVFGKINEWNDAAVQASGYSREDAIGDSLSPNRAFEHSLALADDFVSRLLQGISIRNQEIQAVSKDGKSVWLVVNGIPRLDDDGTIVGSFIIAQDVTDRKRAEDELAAERDRLEDAVAHRTRELEDSCKRIEDANLRLRELNDMRTRFLSSMSHELRTPLNAILGFANLLQGEGYGPLNTKQCRYVEQIDKSGEHLLSLIENLLDLATIDSGGMNVEIGQFSVDECIKDVLEMMSANFREKNIKLEESISSQVTHITCDLGKCRQIVFNLLANALKYTPDGGRVEVSVSKQDDSTARISIKDSGIGISDEEIEDIFTEFRRGTCVTNEMTDGAGLGLALSRRLVAIQGGEIGVHSEVGKGSTFWFTLPLSRSKDGDRLAEKAPDPAASRVSGGRRILLVEDNEANIELTVDMLTEEGYDVSVAKNGEEAIELAQTCQPDLILMDIRMPVMSGYEATSQLRAMSEFSEIPILALTAYADDESIQRCHDSGCSGHIAKPIKSQQLIASIETHLGELDTTETALRP